jgi:hypothetical protein
MVDENDLRILRRQYFELGLCHGWLPCFPMSEKWRGAIRENTPAKV